MMRSQRTVWIIAALAICTLDAVAKPQFKTEINYRSPASAEGQACVKRCDITRNQCSAQCAAEFDSCSAEAGRRADEIHEANQDRLDREMAEYRKEKKRLCEVELDMVGCATLGMPAMPPLRYYIYQDQLTRMGCAEDCGCNRDYDACFRGCGGDILQQTVCVKDCDAGAGKNLFQAEAPSENVALIYIYREKKFMGSGASPRVRANGEEIFRIKNGTIVPFWASPGRLELDAKGFGRKSQALSMDLYGGQVYFVEAKLFNNVEFRDVPEMLARSQMYKLELVDAVGSPGVKAGPVLDCDAPPPEFASCTQLLPNLNRAYQQAFVAMLSYTERASIEVAPSIEKENAVRSEVTDFDDRIRDLERQSKRKNRKQIKALKKELKSVKSSLKKANQTTDRMCRDIGRDVSKRSQSLVKNLDGAYREVSKAMRSRKPVETIIEKWGKSFECGKIQAPELSGCTAELARVNKAYLEASKDLNNWASRSATSVSQLADEARTLGEASNEAVSRIESLTADGKRKNRKEIKRAKKEVSNLKKKIKQNSERQKEYCRDLASGLSAKVTEYKQSISQAVSRSSKEMRQCRFSPVGL